MATIILTGTTLDLQENPIGGKLITITPLSITNRLIHKSAKDVISSDVLATLGQFSVPLIAGGQYNIKGNVLTLTGDGLTVTMPSSGESVTLESLIASSLTPSTGLTVKSNNVAFASLIGTFDFSTDFTLTHSPTGEVNISIAAESLVNPMSSVGDSLYGGASGAATRLAGNTTTTRKFLRQTGDGAASAAPAWDTLVAGDIPSLSGTYALTGHNHSGTYEPADADLSAIAALSPSNDDILQRKAGAWANRTIAQLKTDLSLSGTNTGDQDLSGYSLLGHNHSGVYQPLDADLTAIAALSDPGADRLLFWDESANTYAHLALGTNLSITDTTLNAAGGGGTPGGASGDLQINDGAGAFAASLLKQSTNFIQQRDGANPQMFELYGGYTNSTNYTRLRFDSGGNYKEIELKNLGSFAQAEVFYISNASNEGIQFKTNNSAKIKITSAGHLLPNGANNSYDLGASDNPWRSGYFGTQVSSVVEDAATNTVVNALKAGHQSSDVPTSGFGTGLLFNLKSSTTADQNAAQIAAVWTTATHASRSSELQISVVENAGALAAVAKFDKSAVAGNTGLWLWDADNGQLERVTVGAQDSGGSGFKILRIAN